MICELSLNVSVYIFFLYFSKKLFFLLYVDHFKRLK